MKIKLTKDKIEKIIREEILRKHFANTDSIALLREAADSSAVKRLQRGLGLSETGKVNNDLWKAWLRFLKTTYLKSITLSDGSQAKGVPTPSALYSNWDGHADHIGYEASISGMARFVEEGGRLSADSEGGKALESAQLADIEGAYEGEPTMTQDLDQDQVNKAAKAAIYDIDQALAKWQSAVNDIDSDLDGYTSVSNIKNVWERTYEMLKADDASLKTMRIVNGIYGYESVSVTHGWEDMVQGAMGAVYLSAIVAAGGSAIASGGTTLFLTVPALTALGAAMSAMGGGELYSRVLKSMGQTELATDIKDEWFTDVKGKAYQKGAETVWRNIATDPNYTRIDAIKDLKAPLVDAGIIVRKKKKEPLREYRTKKKILDNVSLLAILEGILLSEESGGMTPPAEEEIESEIESGEEEKSFWEIGDEVFHNDGSQTWEAKIKEYTPDETRVVIEYTNGDTATVSTSTLTSATSGDTPAPEPTPDPEPGEGSGLKAAKGSKVYVTDSGEQWKALIVNKNDDGTWKIEWADDSWDGIGKQADVTEDSIAVVERKRGSKRGGRRGGRGSSKSMRPQYKNSQAVKDVQKIIGAPSCSSSKGCDGWWQDDTQKAWAAYVGKKIDALGGKWSDKKSKIQAREGDDWLDVAATLAETGFGTGITGALKFVTWLGGAKAKAEIPAGPPDSPGARGELDDDLPKDPPVEVEVPAPGARTVDKAKGEKVKRYEIKTKAGVKIGAVYAKPSHVSAGGQRGWWSRIGRADFKVSFKRDMPWGEEERFITDWGGNNVNIPLSKIKHIKFEDEYKEKSGKGAYKIWVDTWDGSADARLEWSPPKGSVRVKNKKKK